MIIDLILDRYDEERLSGNLDAYSPDEFAARVFRYESHDEEKPITDAIGSGDDARIKSALCDYVIGCGYNPNICGYIWQATWTKPGRALSWDGRPQNIAEIC